MVFCQQIASLNQPNDRMIYMDLAPKQIQCSNSFPPCIGNTATQRNTNRLSENES